MISATSRSRLAANNPNHGWPNRRVSPAPVALEFDAMPASSPRPGFEVLGQLFTEEQPRLLEALMANIPDDVFILDRDGTIRYLNRVGAGYRPEQVLGRSLFDFVLPEYHGLIRNAITRAWGAKSRPITK